MRLGKAPSTYEGIRCCTTCGQKLSKYNAGPGCWTCEPLKEWIDRDHGVRPKRDEFAPPHGTVARYNRKCRCLDCKKAQRIKKGRAA